VGLANDRSGLWQIIAHAVIGMIVSMSAAP
jgi:hypothetical protein